MKSSKFFEFTSLKGHHEQVDEEHDSWVPAQSRVRIWKSGFEYFLSRTLCTYHRGPNPNHPWGCYSSAQWEFKALALSVSFTDVVAVRGVAAWINTARSPGLGRFEVLRSLRHYLRANSQGHYTIDRLEQRDLERGSSWITTFFVEKQRNCFKRGRTHMDLLKRVKAILNWTALKMN